MKTLKSLVLATAIVGFGAVAHANGNDTSSDATQAMAAQLSGSQGVIVRVPVNSLGQEDSSHAELRVQMGDAPLSGAQDSVTAWNSAMDTSSVPVVGGDVNSDTSTCFGSCGFGWRNYRGVGFVGGLFYYNYYTPTFYYGSYQYNYCNPTYYDYNYYNSGYNYTYRYYYYPRRWRW